MHATSFASLTRCSVIAALALGAGALPGSVRAQDPAKTPPKAEKEFSVADGYYVEACSCHPPCPCEMLGPSMSCKGVGAYNLTSAKYGGEDISGLKFAYALYIGQTVIVYLDAKDATLRAAGEKFVRAALAPFGPIKEVKDAKVEIMGKDGAYKVSVDGGKIMKFETEPTLGGDKKTPVMHGNTMDALNPTMYQGTCVSCTCKDGDINITLDKGRNAYFNAHMKSSGKI